MSEEEASELLGLRITDTFTLDTMSVLSLFRDSEKNLHVPLLHKNKFVDGTRIGYQSIGTGPGIIIVHGALKDSNDYTHLAIALSPSFIVHIIVRRGHGMSGPQGPGYAITKECEDVQAVREATGANYLFGHSYGGLVSLEAARKESPITKLALYEPGVLIHSMDDSWMIEYEKALQRNDFRGGFYHFCERNER